MSEVKRVRLQRGRRPDKGFSYHYDPRRRRISRSTLVRGLLEEIEHSPSLAKLYAGLDEGDAGTRT
jgi:hypothetical protein